MTELPKHRITETPKHRTTLWPLALALVALWLPVFYRLSFFWETDDQYSHGWFVPLLAAWIFYTRWQTLPPPTQVSNSGFIPSSPVTRYSRPVTLYPLLLTALLLLAGSYFIAESSPDWRMMMWIMAGSAFLGSLIITQIFGGTAWTKHLWFAFFFAMVSVPWPFGPERWLTMELSMLGARISAAVLPLIGIPAVCVGNTIEVSAGTLGVDEACSGIRSFQSSLMAGLFLGELYMLRIIPRIVLCLAGLVAAYGLNIARMLLLSIAVETTGSMEAIDTWHDPAGFAILLLTMAALWGLCTLASCFPNLVSPAPSPPLPQVSNSGFSPSSPPPQVSNSGFSPSSPPLPQVSNSGLSPSSPPLPQVSNSSLSPSSPPLPQVSNSSLSPSSSSDLRSPASDLPSAALATRHSSLVTASVLIAMLLMAMSTEAWFRYQESRKLVKLPEWGIAPVIDGINAEEKTLPEYVKNLLGQDVGFERSWTDDSGRQWHLIFLSWLPGNMKGEGGPHVPDACQTAIGRTITAKSEERRTEVHGIPLPYHIYTIDAHGSIFHLMYVLNDESFAGERLGGINLIEDTHRFERVRRALAGQRRLGNRSMQIALVGESDAQAAEQAMLEILPTLIQRKD